MRWESVTVLVTIGNAVEFVTRLTKQGIALRDVESVDELTIKFTLDRKHLPKVRALCESSGGSLRLLRSLGIAKLIRRALRRPILIFGAVLIMLLTIYLPTRIILIEVEGAEGIPPEEILAQASHCGIYFGTNRKEIRSERVKNALLEQMPQLQWVGINTYGCRAVISVRPRTLVQEETSQSGVSSLVAIRDGFVTEMTILAGNPLCKVGTMVQKGQVLISGYTDLGICIQGTVAKGEVYARTSHSVEVLTPSERTGRRSKTDESKKYSLIIGKNRINFFKGSGISGTSCDKMYSYHYITLPGGYRLPVALVVEQSIWYEEEASGVDESVAQQQLLDSATEYLRSQMVAGRIDNRYEIVTPMEGVYYQIGKYACYELISRPRPEEDLGTNEID